MRITRCLKRREESGLTLVEVLVSGAVFATLSLMVAQTVLQQKQFVGRQNHLDAQASMVQSVLDQIRARIELYPKSFSPLDPNEFPRDLDRFVQLMQEARADDGWTHAWSPNFFGEVSECTECEGRAIYIIEQLKVCSDSTSCTSSLTGDRTEYYLGLYQVRMVLYHPRAFPSAPHARQYYFTVVSR